MLPTDNPYASPSPGSYAPEPAIDRELVKKRLYTPAILTMVGSGLMLAAVCLNIVMLIVFSQIDPEAAVSLMHIYRSTPWLLPGIVVITIGSVISIYGGIQMRRLKRYPVCVLTAIIMTIPFTSPCSWFGLIVGIWTLVILLSKETRAAFKEASHAS